MKITVTQENLNRALQNVSRVASAKTPLPILNNILLRTDKNRLFIAATNLEVAITEYIGAKVENEGSITIPAKLLSEFISNLPKGNIELIKKDHQLSITTGHYNSTINGQEEDEFPELPVINEKEAVTITFAASLLKRTIGQTIIASSNDMTRPMLTGVYLHSYEGFLYAATTDGYRLAEKKLIPFKSDLKVIIPVSSLQEIVRIISDEDSDITVLIDENQARFRVGDSEVTSKLIDANFVDYRQLIPATSENIVKIPKDEFVRITKVASLFARESAGGITLTADEDKKTLSIHSIASQLGENVSEAEADIIGSGSVTLNSRYLLEALGSVDGNEVEFRFSGKLSPCVLTSNDPDQTYQHVIMPLKS